MFTRNPFRDEQSGAFLSLGLSSVDDTLSVMRKLVDSSLKDPATKRAAVWATTGVRPTDKMGYIRAVWETIKSRIRYVPDTYQIEETTSPAIHSRRILDGGESWGDCDDFSMVAAAWLKSLGVNVRFNVVASPKNGGKFDHVRAEAQSSTGEWIPLETTMPKYPFGAGIKTLRNRLFSV